MAFGSTYPNPAKNALSIQAKYQAKPNKSGSDRFSEPERTSSQAPFGYTEEQERIVWWEYVVIPVAVIFAIFGSALVELASAAARAVEWALKPSRIIYTAIVVFVMSMLGLWAVSAANGM